MSGVADVDGLLNALGRLGKFQVKQIIILQLTILSLTFHVLSIVFTGYRPEYTCKNVSVSVVNYTNGTIASDDIHTWREYGQCTIKTFTNMSGDITVNETGCTDGWTYRDFRQESSFATEWNLVCDRELLTDLTQSLYNVGQSIGGIVFTSLSDRFGRKPIHVACHVALFLVTLTTAFISSYAGLAVMRLVTGALQEGTGLTAAVMVLEFAPKEIRGRITTLGAVYWSTGIALVTPIAYLFRNYSWRHLQICLAMLTSWSLIEWWLVDESLRWLIANGKITKAKVIIKQACKVNKKNYEATNSLVYVGLFLMSSSLAGNRFLNFFLESVVEYPAAVMQYLMINRCGRKWTCITFHAICGVALLIAAVFVTLSGSNAAFAMASTVFTLIGKFAITGSFNTIFLYTPELYPTNMRTVGVGMASAACRIGGMMAPFARKTLDVAPWFPGLVFGILCGIVTISLLWVPETNKHELPQKLEECEAWYSENRVKLPCTRGRSTVKLPGTRGRSTAPANEKEMSILT